MERIRKSTFIRRYQAGLVMNFAWVVSTPIFKTYYNLIEAWMFGIISAWVALFGLMQKYLRQNFNIRELMVYTIIFDLIVMIASVVLVNINVKYLLLFELLADGPYFALLRATGAKLNNLYLGRFKPTLIEKFSMELEQRSIWVNLFGMLGGAVLGYITSDIVVAVYTRVFFMAIGVYLELLALKD